MIFRRRRLMELSQASTRDLVNAPIGTPEDHSEVDDTIDDQDELVQNLRDEIEAFEFDANDEPPNEPPIEPPDDGNANGPPKKKYKFRDRKYVSTLAHLLFSFFSSWHPSCSLHMLFSISTSEK